MVTVFGGKKIVWICFEGGGRLNFTSCCCALCVCGDFWILCQVEEFFILNKYMSDPYILIQVHGFTSLSLILYFFLFRLFQQSLCNLHLEATRITSRKICFQFFSLSFSLCSAIISHFTWIIVFYRLQKQMQEKISQIGCSYHALFIFHSWAHFLVLHQTTVPGRCYAKAHLLRFIFNQYQYNL